MRVRHVFMRRGSFAALAVLLSCGGAESPQNPADATAPERVGSPELALGEMEGAPEVAFGRVDGVLEGPHGEILVADGRQHVIRVFDGDGVYLRSIGRQGAGPGEFQRPCCLSWGPEGDLWVRDSGNRRYLRFDLDADPAVEVETVRMAHWDGALTVPITFTQSGELIDVGHVGGGAGGPGLVRHTLGPDGKPTDETAVEQPSMEELGARVREVRVDGGVSRYFYPQPFGPASLVAHGPGGAWATAVSAAYAVRIHGGGTAAEIRRDASPGPPLSAAERSRAEERVRAWVEEGGGTASDYPPIPDRKQPLADLRFDAEGRLWVELGVQDGEDRVADVYTATGAFVERRRWPGSVSLRYPAWIGEDHALGIATDSLGVQRVVRIRFRRDDAAER